MKNTLLAALAITTALVAPVGAQDAAHPRVIAHALGQTEIPAQPERLAVLTYVDLEYALSLGIVPVFAPLSGHNNTETRDYHDAALAALGGERPVFQGGSREILPEAILATNPDLILGLQSVGIADAYAQLSNIAPVVAYEGEGVAAAAWEANLRHAAEALARESEAEEVIAALEARFAEIAAAHPEFAGRSLIFAMPRPSEIDFVTTEDDPSWDFFARLGFAQPETAAELLQSGNSGVSLERLDLLEADILLLAFPFGDAGLVNQQELEEHELFRRLDVVQEGRYRVIPFEVASELAYPSPLSLNHTLDVLEPVLADIAAGL